MDHPFRSAAVGGFNRQDVLSFLEEQAKQATQTQQELQNRLEEAEHRGETLRRERDDLVRELEEVRRELEGVCQSRDSLNHQLEQVNTDLKASREQAAQTAKALERARKEREELRGKLNDITPAAQAYAQLKERTAGVELDAHRRAQAVQEKASGDAQRTRRQVNQWLKRLGQEYDALRSRVEATVAHAASELEKAGASLEEINRLMGTQEDALEQLVKVYNETDLDRVEAPMPLDEG